MDSTDDIESDINEIQNDEPDQDGNSRSKGLDDLIRFFSDT